MYFQIELVMTSLVVISTGLSYALYRGAKKYNELSVQSEKQSVANAEIARSRALEALRYSDFASDTLTKVLAEAECFSVKNAAQNETAILAVANLSSTAKSHAETAKISAQKSSDFSLTARCSAEESKKFSQTAKEDAHTAYVNHLAAKGSMIAAAEHVDKAAEHSMNASGYAIVAAAHSETAGNHARSTGALSAAVADIAAQTKVRLVHRTDYSADGSNIGGR